MKVSNPYHGLLLVPFLWQAALAPWSNGVLWQPFGLPFPMAWQMAGILVTTAILWWVNRCDKANAAAANLAEADSLLSSGKATGETTP